VVGNLNGVKSNEKVVKCSEGLSNSVCIIISRYIHHMEFAPCMAVCFITFFYILTILMCIILY